ncbi:MAG: adaptor protein MecA [Firmicutes bacterium]|nr:adaptor protein MecA [Bacillota bacterium]
MKIEKISDNQIKFILSKDDLDERNIKLSELTYGSEKTQMLFQDMMIQARMEYDFDSEDAPLMIEAIPFDQGNIVVIVTKITDSNDGGFISKLMQQAEELKTTEFSAAKPPEEKSGIDVFSFDDIETVTKAAKQLDKFFIGQTMLYKHLNRYFLILENDRIYEEEQGEYVAILTEYGERHISNSMSAAYLKEHGEMLISHHAIEKLSCYL